VRLGDYAQARVLAEPLMTMGSVDPLRVQVDIDETEAWRVRPGHSALARLRGNPGISMPLSFVGQRVDVFIAAPSRDALMENPTSGQVAFGPLAGGGMQTANGVGHSPIAVKAKQASR